MCSDQVLQKHTQTPFTHGAMIRCDTRFRDAAPFQWEMQAGWVTGVGEAGTPAGLTCH